MKKAYFEWDEEKDLLNQVKHGVSFSEAQNAFLDPKRIIAEDLNHSHKEKRYYCFGKVKRAIMTVQLHIEIILFVSLVQVFGEKGEQFMKTRTSKYTDEPIGEIRIMDDFLPKPKDLILKEESIKVTLSLSKSSVAFFKQQAKKHHSQYQKMIRTLLDRYTEHYKKDKSA